MDERATGPAAPARATFAGTFQPRLLGRSAPVCMCTRVYVHRCVLKYIHARERHCMRAGKSMCKAACTVSIGVQDLLPF